MRLTDEQRTIIRDLSAEVIGPDARITLFGSRVNDEARGGDIDLLVEVPRMIDTRVVVEALLAARIERGLGGRKVDVLLVDPSTTLQPIHRAARACGVEI